MELGMNYWKQNGLPRKGWTLLDVYEDENLTNCDWCGTSIRYVHVLSHPEVSETTKSGCICSTDLTEDYVNPAKREARLRKISLSRKSWMTSPRWKRSVKGNIYRKHKGLLIVIFKNPHGSGYKISIGTVGQIFGHKIYPDIVSAKEGAFKVVLGLIDSQPRVKV
jgi:hypothetical protein